MADAMALPLERSPEKRDPVRLEDERQRRGEEGIPGTPPEDAEAAGSRVKPQAKLNPWAGGGEEAAAVAEKNSPSKEDAAGRGIRIPREEVRGGGTAVGLAAVMFSIVCSLQSL